MIVSVSYCCCFLSEVMDEHSPQVKCVSHVKSVRAGILPYNRDHSCHDTDSFTLLLFSPSLSRPLVLVCPPSLPPCHAMSMLSGSCMDTMSSTVLMKASITVHTQSALNIDISSLSSFSTFSPFFHLSSLFNFLPLFHHRAGILLVIFELLYTKFPVLVQIRKLFP